MKTASITRTALAVVVVLGLCGYAFAGQTIYVDDNAVGSNDGSSWADAYNYLQDALADANSNSDVNEIRVAHGTYKPDLGSGITPGERAATFQLISSVTLKGGFAGFGEPDPNARDISLYETTLSGDINGDDVEVAEPCDLLTEPTRAENSYHVVNASGTDATAILDGFTITGGNAYGDLDYGDPRLSGGGIYSFHGSATLSNCIFRANSAKDEGGGLWSASDDELTLTNCTFMNNAVGNDGGGIYFSMDYYNLNNCKFHNNFACDFGGGIYSMDCYGLAMVTHCKFTGNTALLGGGMAISEDTIVFTGCLFSGNHAIHTGGGLDCFDSTPTIINCTFNQNFAGNIGGGIAPEGTTTISNCIFWGNRDCRGNGETSQISEIVNINYSCVQGWTGDFGGIGNIGNDPLFIDADGPDDVPGTEDDDLRLLPQSSCLDAGDNDAVPPDTFDLDGDSDTVEPIPIDLDDGDRFTDHPGTPDTGNPGTLGGPIVDIGAYEGAGQGFLLSTRMVVIPEQETETFTVALAQDPLQTIPVTVEWSSGDIDITVATGASLTFDSSNYSVPQIVILKAAADIDNLDGLACIEITAPGFSTAVVRAIEADNDPVSTAVLYVDANAPGVNNGSSWAQAYTELRDALMIAARYPGVVKEIHVAQGTYKPAGTSGNSNETFHLVNGVAIYGGYAGFGQPDPDARDIQQYETILSGDLRGDDIEEENPSLLYSDPNRRENCYHVIIGSGTDANTVLDGLNITGGSGSIGAGMFNEGGNPTINQCTFRGNTSYNGSVMYNFQSNSLLTGCTFSNNYGIGMVNIDNSNPTVIDCVFSGNYGSGARNYDNSNPQFVRCLFSDNRSAFGGGMNNHDSSPNLIFCTFSGNHASYSGGGLENRGGNAMITNCVFIGNSVGYNRWGGGGMSNFEGNPTLINCKFTGNFVDADGAGMYIWHDSPVLINCIFSGNLADNDSGGLYNYLGSPILTNCTFSNNHCKESSGGIYDEYGNAALVNCVLWGNSDAGGSDQSAQIDGLRPSTVDYSCIQGWTGNLGGIGNFGADPCFVDPDGEDDLIGTEDDNLRLSFVSPCVDTGDPSYIAGLNETDLDGNPRVIGGRIDMGAYEFQGIQILYVDDDAPFIGDGKSWATAFKHLQDALYRSIPPTEIRVAEGVHKPHEITYILRPPSRDDTFQLINGVTIKGGYAGIGAPDFAPVDPNMRDIEMFRTILSGDMNGDDEPNFANNGDNSLHVVTGSGTNATAVLDGLTIEAGNANGGPYSYSQGGGMYIEDGSPTIRYCTFSRNTAYADEGGGFGAGVFINRGSPALSNCKFIENLVDTGIPDHGSGNGGGICSWGGSSPKLTDCTFVGNLAAGNNGGGFNNGSGNPVLTNCTFKNNSARWEGGGFYNLSGSPMLTNCTFTENLAVHGGAIYISGEFSGTFTDCVFENNAATAKGGAIFHKGFGELNIIRCEFRDGSAERGGAIYNSYASLALSECILVNNQAEYAGAIYTTDGDITLTNCLLVNNQALVWGGALSNMENASRSVNCTFVGNSANYGGAIFSNIECDTTAINSIFWGNTAQTGSQIATSGSHGGSTLTVSYCDIENGLEGLDVPDGCALIWGEGNINAVPCFVDPDGADNVFGTEDDNLRLSFGSPCVDTGDPDYMAEPNETDLDGKPRVIGGRIDMGAYEFCGPIYVDDDAQNDPGPCDPGVSDPLEDGTDAHPFDAIQEAINVAKDGYTVLVRQGSYFELGTSKCIDFLGKNITLTSADPADWDVVDNTIVRGYVQFSGPEGPNCKFTGFRISSIEGAIYGGNHTHATISHCNITGNGPCGATVIRNCDGIISNCLITDNTTFFRCGVFPVIFGCDGLIKNCTIANNESGLSVGTATIENCIIYNNRGSQLAVTNGNKVDISYSNVQNGLAGVVVVGNSHVSWGPGNIDTDPCFVRLGYWIMDEMTLIEGDYHLSSEGWRWNTDSKSWTYDYITSRCIDAGNPGSPLRGELMSVPRDPENVWGINQRINMGAFGGTSQASMPPHDWALLADLNNDGTANFVDFAYQAQDWLITAPEQPGDLNRDGVLNTRDLARLANDWLKMTAWIE